MFIPTCVDGIPSAYNTNTEFCHRSHLSLRIYTVLTWVYLWLYYYHILSTYVKLCSYLKVSFKNVRTSTDTVWRFCNVYIVLVLKYHYNMFLSFSKFSLLKFFVFDNTPCRYPTMSIVWAVRYCINKGKMDFCSVIIIFHSNNDSNQLYPFFIVIYSMEFLSTHTVLSSRGSRVFPVAARLE